MQPSKGINQDMHPNDLPEGFYNYAKNILCSPITNLTENEPGFDESLVNTNGAYKTLFDEGLRVIGVLSTTKFEVFWMTNNIKSIIGTYNQTNDTFTVVYDDTIQPKLDLNLAFPLKAVWRENYIGEIYVSWTDRLNKPKILNIQKANLVNNEKDSLLLPEFIQPTIDFEIQEGGSLKAGTYYGYIQYETNDGKVTDFSLSTFPVYIGPDQQSSGVFNFFGSSNIGTSKNIIFKISDVDQAYDKINFVVQVVNNGNNIKEFYKTVTVNISGRTYIEIPYSGVEQVVTLTSDDILIKIPSYNVVQTITTLNSELVLGGLGSEPELNIQKYVNNWKINWTYEELIYPNLGGLPKYSSPKSFAHDEVYALYAVILFKSGKTSQAFTIPGRAVSTVTIGPKIFNENAVIKAVDNLPTEIGYTGGTEFLTEDFTLNTGDVKYFQTRDTCSWNGTVGTMGYWENQNEQYPNNTDYDIWDLTGMIGSLKNQPVRHHKFPSNSFIKDNLYNADTNYGLTKIDKLGIKLSDVYLPDEILEKVDKIIVCQAKRDFNNSLVVCQDKTSFMGFILNQTDQSPSPDGIYQDFVTIHDEWGTIPVLSTLNRHFQFNGDDRIRSFTPINTAPNPLTSGSLPEPDYYRLKLHSPEILNIQPTLGSTYLKLNYKVAKQASSTWVGQDNDFTNSLFVASTIESTSGLLGNSSPVGNDKKIIKVRNYRYDNANQINFPVNNNSHTDCLEYSENGAVIDINKKFNLFGSGDNLFLSQTFNVSPTFAVLVPSLTTPPIISDNYYHFTLLKYYTNVYNSFLDQDLLVVDKFEYVDRNTKAIYNSDVFLDLYSYNSFTGFPPSGAVSGQIIISPSFSIRTNHVHFIETSLNSGMRWTNSLGNVFNKGNTNYLLDDNILISGNFLLVSPDYNQINEQITNNVFEDSTQFVSSFPHRIIKSLPVTSESKIQQWTQFLPLDYYEIDKSKGLIVNLQSMKDRLLIHTERALFQTKGRSTMSTDEGGVNLTSGELFEFDPIEINPTTNGYTGTQHMFSCNLFREGYYWVDAQQGKVFCFTGESLKELSSEGLYYFFANNLKGFLSDNPHNNKGISMVEDIKNNRVLMSFKTPQHDFTLSYSNLLNKGAWVSAHDYIFDFAFSTRNNLFSIKEGKLYKHDSLINKGVYYTDIKNSSYIDVTFNPYNILSTDSKTGKRVFRDDAIYLNTISWNTDVITNTPISELYKTFTHLTVWNQYQHSSKMTLNYADLLFTSNVNSRNSESNWSTNEFRDLVKNKSLPFIQDIFNNFEEIGSNIDPTIPWYEQERFNNRWFTIRFEFDNLSNSKILIHSLEINKTDSYR